MTGHEEQECKGRRKGWRAVKQSFEYHVAAVHTDSQHRLLSAQDMHKDGLGELRRLHLSLRNQSEVRDIGESYPL